MNEGNDDDGAASGASEALRLHARYRGKVQTAPKVPVRGLRDFATWYTPGVAEPCLAIAARIDDVYTYTNKGNTVAVVSDGSRVLGLGDIGPEAGLPVMEGKALLFKLLGGVDAVPLCIRAREASDIVRAVEMIEPTFGGINLEDIAQPKCFRVLDEARRRVSIPVWHDDQQGTATVLLAGLLAALEVAGKPIESIRIVLFGAGAANVAIYRLLSAYGIDPRMIVACDSAGILHPERADIEANQALFAEKWKICIESNGDGRRGGPDAALRDADVCVAFSSPGPDVLQAEWLKAMADDAILFACANPVPEIWPDAARAAGVRIVATGRSDFANQVNNALVFPGMFRGVLDVRARAISDGMAIAAAKALVAAAKEKGISSERLLPALDDWRVAAKIAGACGAAAVEEGLAACKLSREACETSALAKISEARASAARFAAT